MTDSTGNPWTVLSSREIYENPWMRVVEHQVLTPKGTPGIYGVVSPQSIATGVIPVHDDGTITLVGQYRFPLQQYSWEIPEGGGAAGADPLESVKRELLEETGLRAAQWLSLQKLHLSNCISDEVAHLFVAWDLSQHTACPDDTEVLALRRVPFATAVTMAMAGEITDAMSVASLLKLHLLARQGGLPAGLAALIAGSQDAAAPDRMPESA